MQRFLSPGNIAVLLLLLTMWIPSKFLPEGKTISVNLIDSRSERYENLPELDRSKVEMPDIYRQSLREILDKWHCEIGFWDRSDNVRAWFSNPETPGYFWASYDDMKITRLKYDDETNTIHLKIKGSKEMEKYGVKNPPEDSAYFENHVRQILARAFMSYHKPLISTDDTVPYSWIQTGAVVASALHNDCDIVIEYELPVLKGKTPDWKGKEVYKGKNDLLEACDYSYYELTEKDKYMHTGDDWRISMFLTP